jgi:SAM-dependent methyltransferase
MSAEWFEVFFNEVYPECWGGGDPFRPEHTPKEADFVVAALGLEPPAHVLDLACGHGRHCLALARKGFRMTGVDLTERFLQAGRQAAQEAGLEIEWIRQDMRRIEFDSEFDAAINMFSAFGYFEDDNDDLEVLKRVARALKPRGKFFIDVVNRDSIMAHFEPCAVLQDTGEMLVVERRHFDPLTGINHSALAVVKGGERRDYEVKCRLFNLTEMRRLLTLAGLRFERAYGSYEGEDFERLSRRMLVVAAKP